MDKSFSLVGAVDKAVDKPVGLVWEEVLRDVAGAISADQVQTFLAPLRPFLRADGHLTIEAPDEDLVAAINERYLHLIRKSLERIRPDLATGLVLTVPGWRQQELFPTDRLEPGPAAAGMRKKSRSSLSPKYTFATFVVGASNQFAHAASQAVANQPGVQYNPLFIYGGVGLGKTHLANAIGHRILERNPAARVIYISSDTFMNDLIAALRRDRMESFKERFRDVEVLIVDDVQFLAGRERTQEEFFHTFNSLYENRRQIVLTSDKFPKDIPELEERLRNRFEWGLIADIQPPDLETRVAILEKKAELENVNLPHEVALFLAANIVSNVRELEGSLTRLGAFASLNRCEITLDLAREIFGRASREEPSRSLSIETIQKAVAEFFNIRPRDLRSKSRARTVALPRQVAMYLCRVHTKASFPAIGDQFGGRDHSTVIHATQVIEQRMRNDPEFRDTISRIERILNQT